MLSPKSILVAIGLVLTPIAAQAEWPTRLIKATIPFGAGSAARST